MFDGSDHQVADVLGGDAAGGGGVPHRLPVAAVEREGDAHRLAIVAADLERVEAPARVAPVDRGPAIMAPLLALAAMGVEQQAVTPHDAVDALWIGRCAPGLLGLAAQQGMHAAIVIGRQIGDERTNVGDQLGVGSGGRPPDLGGGRLCMATGAGG